MIHLVWCGLGWLVPAVTFGASLVCELVSESITGDDQYYQEHGLPIALALLTSAAINGSVFWSKYHARPLDHPVVVDSDRIRVACQCGRKLNVAADLAGKRVRCPECAGIIRLPEDPAGRSGESGSHWKSPGWIDHSFMFINHGVWVIILAVAAVSVIVVNGI